MKKGLIIILVFISQINFGQNTLSPTDNVTLGTQGNIGNALIFNGWGESHFIRNETIGNASNGRSRLRMYLTDDWAYDQGFEIIAQRYDGPLRTLLYIPGDGSQTNFFSGASFGGNVGIGTTNPLAKLEVKGSQNNTITATSAVVKIVGNDAGFFMGSLAGSPSYGSWIQTMRESDNLTFPMLINPLGGNVGIGTTSPEAKLDVNGTIQISGGANQFYGFGQASASKPIDVRSGSHYPYVFNWHEGLTFSAHSAYGGIRFYNQGYPDMYGGGVLVMSITNNNVGIGSTNPDSKLTVKGKIHAEEVKIDLAVPADYVFEKYYLGKSSLKPDYNLLTLSEIEEFTKTNHHLPNVPSAKEIKENGLHVGEMSNVLLQKIEELTLYSIEQQKTIEKLEKENKSIKTILERLSKIEEKLK